MFSSSFFHWHTTEQREREREREEERERPSEQRAQLEKVQETCNSRKKLLEGSNCTPVAPVRPEPPVLQLTLYLGFQGQDKSLSEKKMQVSISTDKWLKF